MTFTVVEDGIIVTKIRLTDPQASPLHHGLNDIKLQHIQRCRNCIVRNQMHEYSRIWIILIWCRLRLFYMMVSSIGTTLCIAVYGRKISCGIIWYVG